MEKNNEKKEFTSNDETSEEVIKEYDEMREYLYGQYGDTQVAMQTAAILTLACAIRDS